MSTTRRTLITGAAAAIPAAAIAAVPAFAAADAELIALGREIEAFLPRYVLVSLESCVRGWKAHALASERSGFPNKDRPITPGDIATAEAGRNKWTEEHRVAETELDCGKWNEEYEQLGHEETRLIKAVRTLPATTPEGVRVKALTVALASINWIAHPRETLDYDEEIVRDLCEAVLANLGIQVPAHLIDAV